MLTQLSIENFRGIRDGLFTEFGPINIVVGPNNCGKSTFLEALSLLLTSTLGRDPLGRSSIEMVAFRRNEGRRNEGGHQFLPHIPATWWFRLDRSKDVIIEAVVQIKSEKDSPEEQMTSVVFPGEQPETGSPRASGKLAQERVKRALLLDLDMVRDRAIEQAIWLELFKKRQDKSLVKALNEIYGLSLEALTMGSAGELLFGLPEVGLPIDSLGSGARVSVRLLMGALVTEGSMLMLEEIDAFQSAASLARLARILLDTCAKGDVQLFLTTHRRQTISAFLDAGREKSVDVRVLPFVTGKEGLVRARGISGADALALADSGADLRDLYRSLRAE